VQLTPLYFSSRAMSSDPHRVRISRGRTVAPAIPRERQLAGAMLVAGRARVGQARRIRIKSENILGSFARLEDGSVDALFILTGQPSDPIARAVERSRRFSRSPANPIDRLRQQYPFLQPSLIPSGTCTAATKRRSAPSGWTVLLLCRSDIDAAARLRHHAYVVSSPSQASDRRRMSGSWGRAVAQRHPIPLHTGAARYYRERQLHPDAKSRRPEPACDTLRHVAREAPRLFSNPSLATRQLRPGARQCG
jgi:hypothetical protein